MSPNCTRCAVTTIEQGWLENAIAQDALSFHFQPIVDVSSGQIFAREALVRYRELTGGAIVEEAQRSGRIHIFDSYCRQKAIRVAATAPTGPDMFFVNFLPSSIYEPEACLQSTMRALAHTGLSPSNIVFEVVESESIPSVAKLLQIRDYYRQRGFGFALDDCGTGSNTLEMIRVFKPEYLKIDKSLTGNAADAAQLARLVETGCELHCTLIAEGVETEAQRDYLAAAGIRYMQGWLFGRPAPLNVAN